MMVVFVMHTTAFMLQLQSATAVLMFIGMSMFEFIGLVGILCGIYVFFCLFMNSQAYQASFVFISKFFSVISIK
jgi:hypothetical protein